MAKQKCTLNRLKSREIDLRLEIDSFVQSEGLSFAGKSCLGIVFFLTIFLWSNMQSARKQISSLNRNDLAVTPSQKIDDLKEQIIFLNQQLISAIYEDEQEASNESKMKVLAIKELLVSRENFLKSIEQKDLLLKNKAKNQNSRRIVASLDKENYKHSHQGGNSDNEGYQDGKKIIEQLKVIERLNL